MLRLDFMASDFNPHILCLGSGEEMRALAALLRGFAAQPARTDLSHRFGNPPGAATILLVPRTEEDDASRYGMRPAGDGVFEWGLNPWQANAIAERVETLSAPGEKSGSDIVELGAEGEIPVKLSHGEFTDDFLVLKH